MTTEKITGRDDLKLTAGDTDVNAVSATSRGFVVATFQAPTTNTSEIYVGGGDDPSIELQPGASEKFKHSDLDTFAWKATTVGDKLHVHYEYQ